MDLSETRSLGRCGLRLPELGFGCAPIGELFNKVSEEAAQATLEAAWNSGIRYFDTSPWYGRGMSERRLGIFLKGRKRDEFIVSTKVGRVLVEPRSAIDLEGTPWIGGDPLQHYFDYSYDGIMRSYEDSLKRLQLDRIDLILIHDLDFMHHVTTDEVNARMMELTSSRNGGWRALEELKASNAIKGIGSGVNELGTIPRMIDAVDLDFFLVALRYTLMEQDTLDSELPLCAARNIGVIVGGVFNSGILATGIIEGAKYNYREPTENELHKIKSIERVCDRYQVSLAAAALQFPLGHPLTASIIPGAYNPDQVRQNIILASSPIPASLWADLKAENLLRHDAPIPPTQNGRNLLNPALQSS